MDQSHAEEGSEIEQIIEETYEEVGDIGDPEKRSDFKDAYDKLIEKVSQDQNQRELLLNDEEYNDMQRKAKMRRELKQRTDERVREFEQKKLEKMARLKDENQRKEMEECRFKPDTYSRPNQHRTLEQFLDDQQKYEEDKVMKKNMILDEESRAEGREIHHPVTCENSSKILGDKGREGHVYDRLYQISKERMQNNVRLMMDTPDTSIINLAASPNKGENTFAPQINKKSEDIVRDRPVEDLLYDDAIRRQEAQKHRIQRVQLEEKSMKESKISNTNIEYLVHKFNREFEPVYESIGGVAEGEGEDVDEPALNYRQLGDLLYGMGYLSMSKASEAEERILLSTMWSSLGGEQDNCLPKEVIRAFLIAVEGVKITDGVRTDGPEEFGETKDGDFYPDCVKISKHFKLFYLNRIRYIGLRDKPRDEQVRKDMDANCTFQPVISDATQNYAEKYRQRIADNYDGEKITVLDILTATTNKQQWIEETKKELEEKEKVNCTFKPKTNNYNPRGQRVDVNQAPMSTSSYGMNEGTGDKCFDLYQLSIVKRKEKQDKTSEEVEFEKSEKELTFQPNLYKKKNQAAKKNHKVNQRSVMDNIERMRKAREEREYKKSMTERGYVPGKARKAMCHSNETKPLQAKKPYNYQKRAVNQSKRAPGESTLYKNIGHVKKRNEGDYEEPSFTPQLSTKSRKKTAVAPHYRAQDHNDRRTQAERNEFAMRQQQHALQEMIQHQEDEDDQQQQQQHHLHHQEEEQDQQQELSPEGEQHQNDAAQENEGEEGNPLLFVDVNLGPGRAE